MPSPQCVLFFPGSRPERLATAIASGADIVCVDLEDAVAPEDKRRARDAVVGMLGDPSAARLAVRINHPSTEVGEQDVAAILEADLEHALTIVLPKADARAQVDELHARLTRSGRETSLIPVVETAVGLARADEIARADGVSAVLMGGLDLSVDLGCALDWEALLYARSRCVHAARLGGVEVIDTPFFDIDDPDGLRAEALRSRRLGFDAKAAIHPLQVPVIQEAFAPDVASVERARRVIAASEKESGGVTQVDGVMIDRPAVEAARRVLASFDEEE